jgi:hypothetical protein
VASQPPRDQQVTMLAECDLAVEKLDEEAQTLLHARNEHGRRGSRVVAAEPIHRSVDHLEGPATEVRRLCLSGQLQKVVGAYFLCDDKVVRT